MRELRVFYVCDQVITEDGVSHVGPPEPGFLRLVDVDDSHMKDFGVLCNLRRRLASSLKSLPWIRQYKTIHNCWGPIEFDMKYRSVASGYALIPFNHHEPGSNQDFAVAEEVPGYEACSADLWIRCTIYMETPGAFIDALLGRAEPVSPDSRVDPGQSAQKM
jgi:hypothetical protein